MFICTLIIPIENYKLCQELRTQRSKRQEVENDVLSSTHRSEFCVNAPTIISTQNKVRPWTYNIIVHTTTHLVMSSVIVEHPLHILLVPFSLPLIFCTRDAIW